MAMSKAKRKALDRTMDALVDDLEVDEATLKLRHRGTLTEGDQAKIKAGITRGEQISEFVGILKRRGENAFMNVVSYLEESEGSSHLAKEILLNLKSVEEEIDHLQISRQNEKQLQQWKDLETKFYLRDFKHDSFQNYHDIPKNINILLIGKTGAGKSCTGNTILGRSAFAESLGTESVTKTSEINEVKEDNIVIRVIDTPGIFDTRNAKDIEGNNDLLLEISKTMINFHEGIHLFLLVCNSQMRFTKEEGDTIELFEKFLTTSLYNNCILVLTNARSQFGPERSTCLGDYIEKEKEGRGKFKSIIQRVQTRIIAVENFLGDDFLKNKHRQRLLCSLAQVISDNKGSVYSNRLIQIASAKVSKEREEFENRVKREDQLTMMRKILGSYLIQNYVPSQCIEGLQSPLDTFRRDVDSVVLNSGLSKLNLIIVEDVIAYFNEFVANNKDTIDKIIEMKIEEQKQEKALRIAKLDGQMIENLKMQCFVILHFSEYLAQQDRASLRMLKSDSKVPGSELDTIMEGLEKKNILVGKQQIVDFIAKHFFEDVTILQTYIKKTHANELQKQFHRQSQDVDNLLKTQENINKLDKLRENIPIISENETNEQLQLLLNDLLKYKFTLTIQWFRQKTETNNIDDGDTKLLENFLRQHSKYICNVIQTILQRREQQNIIQRQNEREVKRNAALKKIAHVIDQQLRSYLIQKDAADLVSIHNNVVKKEVPEGLYNDVYAMLTEEELNILDEYSIKKEIIMQIVKKQEVINECIQETKVCFAGDCKVSKRGGKICKISSLAVNDEVLVFDSEFKLVYESVYLLSHANPFVEVTFIRLNTNSGQSLLISTDHLLPVSNHNNKVPAKEVLVGDVIFTVQNGVMAPDLVTSVTYERHLGAYCPMTMSGSIVVDDVAASCYTTFFDPTLAHALLSPIRLLFRWLPLSIFKMLLPYDTVEGMPVLLAKCRSLIVLCRAFFFK